MGGDVAVRVLVGCEFSGTVGAAFLERGHDVMTCDLRRTERDDVPHYQGDVFNALRFWRPTLLIAHPPCTYLSGSGARWLTQTPAKPRPGVLYGEARQQAQRDAVDFVRRLLDAPVQRIAVENPVGMLSSLYRPADQYVQPWQFGHGEIKKTGLWLKNLPKLQPTDVVAGREARVHRMPPGPDRERERSRTYQGIAAAMADQWGGLQT